MVSRALPRGPRALAALLPAIEPLADLLQEQGLTRTPPHRREGLHPLVVPLAAEGEASVVGVLRWPSPPPPQLLLVRTERQPADLRDGTASLASLTLRPLGTPAQYARRAAAEAEASAGPRQIISAAAALSSAVAAAPYVPGELGASKLQLDQYLLLRVGPFPDVWERMARLRLERADETAALVAAERATAGNPSWGCCLWLQAQLMGALGRREEERDLALAALETPLWTLGASLAEVQAAAQLAHVDDVFALFKQMEEALRLQQNAPPRSIGELALARALECMDEVVRRRSRWDDARPHVASALEEAGLTDVAELAAL
ncbi:hypothetical protein AB1Y20_007757 [Prymnesium parvum]|uniref:Uncharacterized protein n=1 Tax=Prymnesium parvum TaxID=97485 RepID=A0AB34IUS3_PRYPA